MFHCRLGNPFEATVYIPKMSMDSHYKSSGVLLVIPASGNGTFHASMSKSKLYILSFKII